MVDTSKYNDDIDAQLSNAAYGDAPTPEGYTVDTELSNPVRKVYVDKQGNATVAMRGTKWKDPGYLDELGTDLLIGLGLQDKSNRFKKDVDITNKAIAKYGRDKVKTVGHSQGGSRAIYVSRATGIQGTGFNAAFSPLDALRNRTYSNARSIRTVNDLVSGLSNRVRSLKTTTIGGKRGVNAHSLLNFWH